MPSSRLHKTDASKSLRSSALCVCEAESTHASAQHPHTLTGNDIHYLLNYLNPQGSLRQALDSGQLRNPSSAQTHTLHAFLKHSQGSLRQALDSGLLRNPSSGATHLAVALGLAHDVACAMLHLHSDNILHSDLKVCRLL